ncbi:hypothetical protein LXL04_017826 [Taraxacum kok-saghyz]
MKRPPPKKEPPQMKRPTVDHIHIKCLGLELNGLEQETSDHLLVSCDFTKQVYLWILDRCGMQHNQFSNVLEFIDFAATWAYRFARKVSKANSHNYPLVYVHQGTTPSLGPNPWSSLFIWPYHLILGSDTPQVCTNLNTVVGLTKWPSLFEKLQDKTYNCYNFKNSPGALNARKKGELPAPEDEIANGKLQHRVAKMGTTKANSSSRSQGRQMESKAKELRTRKVSGKE